MTDIAEKKSTTASSSTQHKKEEIDLKGGPFSVLQTAMDTNTQVIVRCRFDKMLIGYVRAFDKHFNLLLTQVQEVSNSHDGEGETKHRTFNSVVLRGDSVVYVLKLQASP
jgi:small nuclear ribonucleoprotein (snRNP)-like protein